MPTLAKQALPVTPNDPRIEAQKTADEKKAAAAQKQAETRQQEAAKSTTAAPMASATIGTGVAVNDAAAPGPTDKALPLPPQASFNGSYTQEIELDIPAFRGLEPKLRLHYDSNHGPRAGGHYAGWLGHGWSLYGISEIVRITPGRGTPRFDANDTWLVDGDEMVLCQPGMESPSCGSGGTHTTRVESYRKIGYEAAQNRWTITNRDGVRSIYRPVGAWDAIDQNITSSWLATSYRYLLEKQIDTNGNELVFSYTCQKYPICTPTLITYGPHQIRFYSEARPDFAEFATGLGFSRFNQRLRAVDVSSYGGRARAYQLAYDQSPATGYSRLISLRQHSRTATVDAQGGITGGDPLPAHEFQYSGSAVSFATAGPVVTVPILPVGTSPSTVLSPLKFRTLAPGLNAG